MSMLSAAGHMSRSASAVVAKAARGFHVFRVDGYSVTTTLPGGERVTSLPFRVGGRSWLIDYYPNGTDGSIDSADTDAIAMYLRLNPEEVHHEKKERVRADYKFSLLDHAGTAAYELSAETGIFTSAGYNSYDGGDGDEGGAGNNNPGCGYAAFISKEDLGRRRESLLREDSLAIRCDVGVAEVETLAVVAPNKQRHGIRLRIRGHGGRVRSYDDSCGSESPDEYDGSHDDGGGSRRRSQAPPDDKEFIRRYLTSQRRKY